MKIKIFLAALFILLNNPDLFSWIYPEHRDIALLAIQNLNREYRKTLDKLWTEARKGYELRLTEWVIDTAQGINPQKLDYASWPAISGDHSCSPENLLYNVLQTDWILEVADIAAQLKVAISKADKRSRLINALRDSDIKLQRADPEYATRAGSNNVHFLLARLSVDTNGKSYLKSCLKEGAELNAIGAYTWFHISALFKAVRYADENLTPSERSALILGALADEAFALHFLEDAYASGHAAGTWGNASQRKGTHDYYNERGLEVVTWEGKRMILMGDAYMRSSDAATAAATVRLSIEQLLDAAAGKTYYDYSVDQLSLVNEPDSFNVCKNNFMPDRNFDINLIDELATQILIKLPVPGLATGLGELPRFRTELGLFVGVVPAIRVSTINGGFGSVQTEPGVIGGLSLHVRIGLGIEGVLNESGDGLVFLDIGWRQDGASTQQFGETPKLPETGRIAAAISGRDAYDLRLRMPFYLIPFDLLLTAPILIWAAPETYTNMAVVSGNGGLIPWQTGIATPIGRFQFVLGREVGVSLYGGGKEKDAILVPFGETTYLLTLKSVQIDIPLLEYRPFRTFSLDQSSSLMFQLNFGVDIPYNEALVAPESSIIPELKPIWYIGLRAAFDWRYYF